MLFNEKIIALSHCYYLPYSRSANLATEASASIRFLEISQRLLLKMLPDPARCRTLGIGDATTIGQVIEFRMQTGINIARLW